MKLLSRYGPAVAALLCSTLALASGGGGGGGEHAQTDWDTAMTAKVKVQLDAHAWDAALDLLAKARAKEPANADWWNYTGFAQRKSGHLPEAFTAYREALRLAPKHLGAHEYLGEAYLQNNQPDQAREQLAQLQTLCGNCEQYQDLHEALQDYAAKHPG